MKVLLVAAFALACHANLSAQTPGDSLQPRIDERVELLSIAYRLAVPAQNNESLNPIYAHAVDEHFHPHSKHPFIVYIRKLAKAAKNEGNDLGSWEIPSLALHVGPAPQFEPLVGAQRLPNASKGWDDRTLLTPKFLSLLRRFYTDAGCESFLEKQRPYYRFVDEEYEKKGTRINQAWFQAFFSLPSTETYYPIISLLGIGSGDYIRVDFPGNRRNTHTLFASAAFDNRGIPADVADPRITRANLHEYTHAFANQLVDRNLLKLKPYAEQILSNAKVSALMKGTFYGNSTFLLYESLVRACVIEYLAENGQADAAKLELRAQERAGFFWISGLVDLLNSYRFQRQSYEDLSHFMPNIVQYFERTAREMNLGNFSFPAK